MSLRVVGYQDGKPVYEDQGPSRGRCAGYGGSAIGHTITVVLTHAQRKARGTADSTAAAKHRRSV